MMRTDSDRLWPSDAPAPVTHQFPEVRVWSGELERGICIILGTRSYANRPKA